MELKIAVSAVQSRPKKIDADPPSHAAVDQHPLGRSPHRYDASNVRAGGARLARQ
jgi:hypothetical protein